MSLRFLTSNKQTLIYMLMAEYINIKTKRAWFTFPWEYDCLST